MWNIVYHSLVTPNKIVSLSHAILIKIKNVVMLI